MTEEVQRTLNYYAGKQCSIQWRDFLNALADEFAAQFDIERLRALMKRIGERFALARPLEPASTLDDLETAINRVWTSLDWGWARIVDVTDHLGIRHHCVPLDAAFGTGAAAWSSAFLQGVYQQWFSALGIDPALAVRQSDTGVAGVYEYRLSRE